MNCRACAGPCCLKGSNHEGDCEGYKPITNADRIRTMSDEELAWELARICRMPFYKDDSEIDGYEVDFWAKWLKQEATDGATD